MSQAVITQVFEQWKAQQAATNEAVTLDEFVFAHVPDLDVDTPIDRNEVMPPAAQIVHRQAVSRTGVVNDNAVVYSVVLGADTGDFTFNWVGLINKASGTLAMIVHAPEQQKLKTKEGQQGNVLTRSFLMEFNGAQAETNINTPAETWQIDFTARMAGMDERQRLENVDVYGAGAFFDDGYLVAKNGTQYFVTKGVGYVAGLRSALAANQNITVTTKPVKVWLDVSWTGTLTSAWDVQQKITVAATHTDYVQDGIQHYVFALASIDANGNITDLRPKGSLGEQQGNSDFLRKDANLSDLKDKAKSRESLELGSAATKNTGTSGDAVPLLSGANTWGAEQFFDGRVNSKAGLELYHATPYIDFHFNNSDEDYTSRIIESAKGTLTAQANWSVSGTITSGGLASFKSGVDITGRYGNISVNGMALLIKPTTAGYATYIMCQDSDGSNLWYVGKGSSNVNDAVFNNYKAGNNRIELKSDGAVNIASSNVKPVGVNNQVKITAQDAIKIVQGDYGAIIRRSENNLYIIPTEKGQAEDGGIGKLRPFSIALDTGIVSMSHGLTLGAALPVGSGGTGSTTAAGARANLGCGAAATMSYSTAAYTGLAGSQTEAASTAQLVGLRDAVYTKTAGDARYQLKNTASKAANGWYKDTSTGLIFQWGQASGAANAKITVTYPIAFPNACLNASLTDIWPQLSMYTAAISAKTATTLSVGLATTSVFWFAIGY